LFLIGNNSVFARLNDLEIPYSFPFVSKTKTNAGQLPMISYSSPRPLAKQGTAPSFLSFPLNLLCVLCYLCVFVVNLSLRLLRLCVKNSSSLQSAIALRPRWGLKAL
jgi:hypothetical protein